MLSGILRSIAGQPDLAIEHFETSSRLSPRDRIGNTGTGLGGAYFLSRRFEDAATILLSSLDRAPAFAVTYRLLASCYAHMGRLDDANEIVRRLRVITPVVMERATRYRNPEHRELFLSGLQLATSQAS